MPLIIALMGILIAAYVWSTRVRRARDITVDLADMANDVRLAARRFGFSRKADTHPVDSIDDPNLTITAIAASYLELTDLPTKEQRDYLNVKIRAELRVSQQDADEMSILGRWLMGECGGPQPAIARLGRRLARIGHASDAEALLSILRALSADGMSGKQGDALEELCRILKAS